MKLRQLYSNMVKCCVSCGAPFEASGSSKTCSTECSIDRKAKRQSERYFERKVENPGLFEERSKSWRLNNLKRSNELRRRSYEKDVAGRLIRIAKERAKELGVPFDLRRGDVEVPKVCPVLGTDFVIGTQYSASLDRIVPALGYVKGNVQVLSRLANSMKSNATEEELRKFADWINQKR